MGSEKLQQTLDQVSQQIQDAQESVILATDPKLFDQAWQMLEEAEQELQKAREMAGTDATENPQFQQAYEQIHNIRQRMQEIERNNNDVL
jgi:hypothetical protein